MAASKDIFLCETWVLLCVCALHTYVCTLQAVVLWSGHSDKVHPPFFPSPSSFSVRWVHWQGHKGDSRQRGREWREGDCRQHIHGRLWIAFQSLPERTERESCRYWRWGSRPCCIRTLTTSSHALTGKGHFRPSVLSFSAQSLFLFRIISALCTYSVHT